MSYECSDLKMYGWSENKVVLNADYCDSYMEQLLYEY